MLILTLTDGREFTGPTLPELIETNFGPGAKLWLMDGPGVGEIIARDADGFWSVMGVMKSLRGAE